MATIRKTVALGPGIHTIRFVVVSPSGHVRLRPVNVDLGAEYGAAEGLQTWDAIQAKVYAGASLAEPLTLSDAVNAGQWLGASLAERIRMYDKYRPSGLTIADAISSSQAFRAWWLRHMHGGSLWFRRPGPGS